MASQAISGYPVDFNVDYPEGLQNRLKALFRIVLALPILVIVALITGGAQNGFLVIGPALMIVFRRKYPRWWFDFNVELARFEARVFIYLALMREEYPSTDDHQAVTLDFEYPDVEADLNRWLPLVKWFLAIPHYVVLTLLGIVAILALVVAWFAILITGRCPRGLFDFVLNVGRWFYRVQAYAFLLTTDKYPPFSLR